MTVFMQYPGPKLIGIVESLITLLSKGYISRKYFINEKDTVPINFNLLD
jgi:hypothetical protein